MDISNSPIPKPGTQPPTVDFIDHQLPSHHPMFHNPPVRYDGVSGQYIPISQELVPRPTSEHHHAEADSSILKPSQHAVNLFPPRPEWTDTKAMEFWNRMFPEALDRLRSTTEEPKGRAKTEYSIRDVDDWDAVYGKLERARAKYQNEGGAVGLLRKVRRKAADHVVPVAEIARNVSKAAPDSIFSTPVLGAVQVLLDAAQVAATVRSQALAGFDGLIPIFSDVELFLGTFPRDGGLRNASLGLTVATLVAIERVIGFFIRNEALRGMKALAMGSHYESDLLQSLGDIDQKSRNLMEEAAKSHIFEFHIYSQETRRIGQRMLREQERLATSMNAIQQLLAGHIFERDRQLAIERERHRQEMEASRQEVVCLRIENGRLRGTALLPQGSIILPPQHLDQNMLRQIIDAQDIDMADIAFAIDKTDEFPARERTLVEQIIHTGQFRNWITSPFSSKLLVHWDGRLPKTIADISPLTLFCVSMTQMLRVNPRFLTILWVCGRHTDPAESSTGGHAMVASLVDQLLRQHFFDVSSLFSNGDVDFDSIQSRDGKLDELVKILELLVQQLPETVTLICLVDGITLFERDQLGALPAFACLVRLAGDLSLQAAVKILFTSTPGCDVVRTAFEDEDLILNVNGLPRLTWAPSEERVAREFSIYVEED